MPVIEANASLVPEDQQLVAVVVKQNNLQPDTALSLQTTFAPLFAQARGVIEKSKGIVVTDANQKLEIKMARACRLELKAIRVAGDKLRKEVKEESLRRSKAIDGFGNILEDVIRTEEDRLQKQEDFAAIQEQERKTALKEAREKVLLGIQVDPNLYSLADMTETTFQQLVEGTKLARAAEAERVRKAEAEKIEREAKDAADREAQRLENDRLRKEAEEKEAALKVERERVAQEKADAEAKAKLERELADRELKRLNDEKVATGLAAIAEQKRFNEAAVAERKKIEAANAKKIAELKRAADAREAAQRIEKEKIEADLKAERDAQAKRKADAEEAAHKAAAAPDKDKLLNYANAIRALEVPTFSTDAAQAVGTVIVSQRDKFVQWLESKTEAL